MSKNVLSNCLPLSNFQISSSLNGWMTCQGHWIWKKFVKFEFNFLKKFISDVDSTCNQEILEFRKTNWFYRSHPVGWRYYVSVHHMFSRILNCLFVCVVFELVYEKSGFYDKIKSYTGIFQSLLILKWNPILFVYSNLPNNRVGPFNRVGGRFLRNQ